MFADDSDMEDKVLQIPIYVELPPRAADGGRRHLLLTIFVTLVTDRSVWVEATWDVVDVPHVYQLMPYIPSPSVIRVDGARILMPGNVLVSPIYVVVTHVNGVYLHRRLLIAVTAHELMTSDGTPRLDVDFDVMTLPRTRPQQVGRPRRMLSPDLLRYLLLSDEPHLRRLREDVLSMFTTTPERVEDSEDRANYSDDDVEELAVEDILF
ncbi:hypothetical protein PYCCODRAFT_1424987 [Trametes coccinea BRFM310]|uniref:Uncharacterized protein n=1 Tax=Trametes coccinea (strain BRFM310) TaxID=1353009 RepID=A0A1Y2IPS4_TRAC3|nr:hypothetical protein PYCCODRAFT_1424987 [Trametes coccinea BRFM310]